MAAVLLVVGSAMITERVQKDKEKKRLKKEHDETRYRELVEETGRRMSRTDSGQVAQSSAGVIDEPMHDERRMPEFDEVAGTESGHPWQPSDQIRSQDSSHNSATTRKRRSLRGLFRKK